MDFQSCNFQEKRVSPHEILRPQRIPKSDGRAKDRYGVEVLEERWLSELATDQTDNPHRIQIDDQVISIQVTLRYFGEFGEFWIFSVKWSTPHFPRKR